MGILMKLVKFSKFVNKYKNHILLAIILLFIIIYIIYHNTKIVDGFDDGSNDESNLDKLCISSEDHDNDPGDKKRRINKIKNDIYNELKTLPKYKRTHRDAINELIQKKYIN